ncbi:glycosyltransferase [Parabacteroides sp. ZJ-118]|uniref:glycosyltransferase family 2 protein n=1 Tax=Parabacteroides sp. ZJ-118 TaxID=2709398 RepID=UPI0013ED324C|nr:glycosyltransferase [Parabacteroides sp. ZJ-118]
MSDTKEVNPLVAIRCITYNHEPYIRDALEGFVMQKTNFPFVAIVHDDASTDGTAAIIREYAEKYPDIIKPIYETENQYSKRDGSLRRIMDKACEETGAKYYALCEGDDYWTDPLKLQKQVDFLESHPEYSMCASNAKTYNCNTSKYISHISNVHTDIDFDIEKIILNGGDIINTCSIMYRTEVYSELPDIIGKFHVGDYPLQVLLSHKYKVRIFKDNMCVYRIFSKGSWTSNYSSNIYNSEKISVLIAKNVKMYETLDRYTDYSYHNLFQQKILTMSYNLCLSLCNKLRLLCSHPRLIIKTFGIYGTIVRLMPEKYKSKVRNFTYNYQS